MAFGNWGEVVKEYEEIFLHTQYAEHARGILAIIPAIRANPYLETLLPGTTLGALFLKLPNFRTRILIWYKGDNKYEISLYHPDKGNLEEIVVETEKIMDTLVNFSNNLSKIT